MKSRVELEGWIGCATIPNRTKKKFGETLGFETFGERERERDSTTMQGRRESKTSPFASHEHALQPVRRERGREGGHENVWKVPTYFTSPALPLSLAASASASDIAGSCSDASGPELAVR